MTVYNVDVGPYDNDAPFSGSYKIKLGAGVAVLTAFDVSAIWLDASRVVTLNYTDNQNAQIEDGLPVDNSLTVNELKAICTQLGLSTSGLKADLLARVQEVTS